MDGWVFDEKCIARQSDIKGNHLPLDKIVHFEVLQDAVTSVLNGSVSISSFLTLHFRGKTDFSQMHLEVKRNFSCHVFVIPYALLHPLL